MRYTYAYKTSDGTRHEEAVEAESREAVFAALRAKGIKAIKVVAADGSKANGEVRGVSRRKAIAFCLIVGAVAGGLCFLAGEWVGFGLNQCEGGLLDGFLKSVVLLDSLVLAFLGFPQFKNRRCLFWLLVCLIIAGSFADFLLWSRDSAVAEQQRKELDDWHHRFDDKINKVTEASSSTLSELEGLRKDMNLRAHKEKGSVLDYQLVKSTNSNEAIPKISYPPHLVPLSETVLNIWNADNFEGALILAHQCEDLIDEAIYKVDGGPYEQDAAFAVAKSLTYNVLAEECFYRGEYGKSADYWDRTMACYQNIMPWERSWRDAARLRAKGQRLKFFTPDEISEIRSWEEDTRHYYLSCLAELGYLLPIELDFANNDYHFIDYARVFDLKKPIDYLAVAREEYVDADGAMAHSNSMILQRCGRNKFQLLDLDSAVSVSLGKQPEKHKNQPILIRPTAQTVKALENVSQKGDMPPLVFDREKNKDLVVKNGYLSTNEELKVELKIREITPDVLD